MERKHNRSPQNRTLTVLDISVELLAQADDIMCFHSPMPFLWILVPQQIQETYLRPLARL